MLEQIKEKLKEDIKCDLTIDELKILYEIDSDIDMSLYRKERDNCYEDLVKIFGVKCVAQSESQVTIDTICYIGNIDTDTKNIYNLRYVYGSVNYNSSANLPLENLEKVFGSLFLYGTRTDLPRLDNLSNVDFLILNHELNNVTLPDNVKEMSYRSEKISNVVLPKFLESLTIEEIGDEKDIKISFPPNLKKLFDLSLRKISDYYISKLPDSLEELKLDSIQEINNKGNANFPSSIKTINFRNCKKFNNLKLPDDIEQINIDSPKIDGLTLPKNLKRFFGFRLSNASNIKFNDNLEELYLNNIDTISGLRLPPNLKVLALKLYKEIKTFLFPETLEELSIITNEFTRINSLPSKLKKITINANRVYNIIFPETVEELILHLNTTEGLVLPFNLKRLYLYGNFDFSGYGFPLQRELLNLSKLVFPEHMEVLSLEDNTVSRIIIENFDLEQFIYYKLSKNEELPKTLIDLYDGGLRYVDSFYISHHILYEINDYIDKGELIALDNKIQDSHYRLNIPKLEKVLSK